MLKRYSFFSIDLGFLNGLRMVSLYFRDNLCFER